jgi:hypothetical protein
MVIGENFAWGHLPKTGGDATVLMFRVFPELLVSVDAFGAVRKHDVFAQRADEVEGKTLALNLRRLPSWVLSHAIYVARHGLHPDYVPRPVPPADELADSDLADTLLGNFISDDRYTIGHWLRMEHLRSDFVSFISKQTRISLPRRANLMRIRKVNAERYDHRIDQWFRDVQIRRMYERNPLWASVERQLYPD